MIRAGKMNLGSPVVCWLHRVHPGGRDWPAPPKCLHPSSFSLRFYLEPFSFLVPLALAALCQPERTSKSHQSFTYVATQSGMDAAKLLSKASGERDLRTGL